LVALAGLACSSINGENGLDERGARIPTGGGGVQTQHDILTGTNIDGTAFAGRTCMGWTGQGIAQVGHFDRNGGGSTGESWSSAHENAGCATVDLVRMRGGAGRFYCFATTP